MDMNLYIEINYLTLAGAMEPRLLSN